MRQQRAVRPRERHGLGGGEGWVAMMRHPFGQPRRSWSSPAFSVMGTHAARACGGKEDSARTIHAVIAAPTRALTHSNV